jgi:subtilisin family serine protease
MSPRDESSSRNHNSGSLPKPISNVSSRPARWASPTRRARRLYAALGIESLEERFLPTATPAAELVAPGWFENVAGADQPLHAGAAAWSVSSADEQASDSTTQSDAADWIVRFQTSALTGISSASQTASLLVGSGVEFEVLRGLGLVGEVLVRSHGATAETAARFLADNPNVASFEEDGLRQFLSLPNDSLVSQLWALQNTGQNGGLAGADIDAAAAWNLATGSRNTVVAVVDTGIDYQHGDLAANVWTNPGEVAGNGIDDDHDGFIDDVHGYDFANRDGDPMDDNGHGTHVSGTIAAVGNNGAGVAGINWSSSLMGLKFLGADGSGYTSDGVLAINYATMMRTRFGVNVRVINMSWGGGGYSAALGDAIQAAGSAGILCVAAAGNSGRNNDATPNYPSNYGASNLLAVAATDNRDNLASFSNYGATTVDLAAPGVSIVSTYPGNRYASLSGTSMATPHVAGVAALAWSLAPNATVAEIKSAILGGVDRVASLSGKVLSGGRLNAYNTLRLLNVHTAQPPVVAPDDHGNNAATATAVNVGGAVAGQIGAGGDRDWFKFQAVAGRGYVFRTQLGTLPDSVLTLYDRNGATALATNDDYAGLGLASQINWTAPASGTYYLEVKAFSGSQTGSYSLDVRTRNSAPVLAAIADQTMSVRQDALSIPLKATDTDGDRLTFAARVLPSNPLPGTAYDLDRRLGLYWTGNYLQNYCGAQEKWLRGAGSKSYYILPNGELHQWAGSLRASPLVATLSPDYWTNPQLLWNAQPAAMAIPADAVSLSVQGNVLTINPRDGLLGQFSVRVIVSDGVYTDTKTFKVTVSNNSRGAAAASLGSFQADTIGPAGGRVARPESSTGVGRMRWLTTPFAEASGRATPDANIAAAVDAMIRQQAAAEQEGGTFGRVLTPSAWADHDSSGSLQGAGPEWLAAVGELLDQIASQPSRPGLGSDAPDPASHLAHSAALADLLGDAGQAASAQADSALQMLDHLFALLTENDLPTPEGVAG